MDNNSYTLFGIDFGSNPGQRELIREINEDCQRKPVVFCSGSAGTGKTFAALAADGTYPTPLYGKQEAAV